MSVTTDRLSRGLVPAPIVVVLAVVTGLSASHPQEGVDLVREGSHVDVLIGGRPFTT